MRFLLTALCSLALTLAAFLVGAGSSAGQLSASGVEAKMKVPPGVLLNAE